LIAFSCSFSGTAIEEDGAKGLPVTPGDKIEFDENLLADAEKEPDVDARLVPEGTEEEVILLG